MTLFDVLSDVLFFKKGDQFQTIEAETEVNPYMLNRWITMHSPSNAKIVNLSLNKFWNVFQNKRDWYRFCITIFPRNRFTKIEYIKKAAKDKTAKDDMEEVYQILARNLEISVREVKLYIEQESIDLTNFKKVIKNGKK